MQTDFSHSLTVVDRQSYFQGKRSYNANNLLHLAFLNDDLITSSNCDVYVHKHETPSRHSVWQTIIDTSTTEPNDSLRHSHLAIYPDSGVYSVQ